MADLGDLKSPQLAGHSRGVANLAAEAAGCRGCPARRQPAATGRSAARPRSPRRVQHRLGQAWSADRRRAGAGPPAPVPDRPDARPVAALARSREIAARHHERLDGSGYPPGLTAASLTPVGPAAGRRRRLPRDDRTPPAPRTARRRPGRRDCGEVRAGRLDGDAVGGAAGRRPSAPARRDWPAGLTAREVEVLGLLARGLPTSRSPGGSWSPRRRSPTTWNTSTPKSR